MILTLCLKLFQLLWSHFGFTFSFHAAKWTLRSLHSPLPGNFTVLYLPARHCSALLPPCSEECGFEIAAWIALQVFLSANGFALKRQDWHNRLSTYGQLVVRGEWTDNHTKFTRGKKFPSVQQLPPIASGYVLWPNPQTIFSFHLGANFFQWKQYAACEQLEKNPAVKIFQN